jgi:hypothetical protein
MKKYYSEAEIYENQCINHINFLENPITDIHILMPHFKTVENKNNIAYLRSKLTDIKKIKATVQSENLRKVNEILNFENIKKEIIYEINIVNRDIDEMKIEKVKLEEEMSKIKVFDDNIA